MLGADHEEVRKSTHTVGVVLHYSGEYKESAHMLEKAFAIEFKTLSDQTYKPVVASYKWMGDDLQKKCQHEHALQMFQKVKAIEVKLLGSDHATVAETSACIDALHAALSRSKEVQPSASPSV